MTEISRLIRYDGEFLGYLNCLFENMAAKSPLPIAINGLTSAAQRAFLCESVREAYKRAAVPVLLLAASEEEARQITDLLSLDGIRAGRFPARDFVFHNVGASHDVERERLSVLSGIRIGAYEAVVTTPTAALGYTIPRERLDKTALTLKVGTEISPIELADKLTVLGFAYSDSVEGRGQFSRRGGILDFFGDGEYPVRIEFFGDEIDRMVYFDPITQRATDTPTKIELLPAVEVTVDRVAREAIGAICDSLLRRVKDDVVRQRLQSEEATVKAGLPVDFRDKYLGVIYPERECLLDYLADTRAVLLVGTNACTENLKKGLTALEDIRSGMLKEHSVTDAAAAYSAIEADLEAYLSLRCAVHVNTFSGGLPNVRLAGLFGFRCKRTVAYGDNIRMLNEDLLGYRRIGYRTLLVCESRQGADSLMSTLSAEGISTIPAYEISSEAVAKAEAGSIFVTVGSYDGFDLLAPRIAVLSMAQSEGARIIANRRRQLIKRKLGSASERIMSYSDLSVGDLVVHESYGIGLFEGIQTVTVDGITRDYITVKYAGEDKLLVPCDKLEYVSRYIGANDDNSKVKLSKMGGGDWLRTKTKAKSAARDIADELIRLYAERMRLPGFAFPADSEMELEFASQFEYEETEGQLCAIDEIKRDMMRPSPMNRLLCGDVGFGKTEVALRAAFKAIMGGKQVAFLVPTTILAMQHYQTALSRMRNYPVTVEMLTRFRTPKEEEAILRRAKRGEIDILIGTHKLLSKKLEFRDVGLLIVDEEQRFGVAQKEKLKQAFKNIDVLSLSATPIPRTLNMAMNGISDISVLDEAPGERVPVQTYVTEHDDGMINDAIKKELFRGGQVLYLYNKVEDIAFVADKIMRAIPEARVAYAHGQMDRDELEDIWQGLVRGEIDVLVCTTIIETGVDLPNANTLIIENADRFGLSQLHQIRGRVGRSQRQAYAYLTYRKGKVLTEIAEKRLSAIREFAEFGAGFKVALRDLEIRGAGNLLGAEQHGYIAGVGYDLYVKLLNEAVIESRGEKKEKRVEAEIEISASAHIPESYIGRAASRMEMYKKIALIRTPEDRGDVYDELCDRFGEPPRVTERLLDVALLKSLATEIGLRRVKQVGDSVFLDSPTPPELDLWSEVIEKHKGLSFRYSQYGFATVRLKGGEDAAHTACAVLLDYFKIKEKSQKDENE